jgi:hypothetical protein
LQRRVLEGLQVLEDNVRLRILGAEATRLPKVLSKALGELRESETPQSHIEELPLSTPDLDQRAALPTGVDVGNQLPQAKNVMVDLVL